MAAPGLSLRSLERMLVSLGDLDLGGLSLGFLTVLAEGGFLAEAVLEEAEEERDLVRERERRELELEEPLDPFFLAPPRLLR